MTEMPDDIDRQPSPLSFQSFNAGFLAVITDKSAQKNLMAHAQELKDLGAEITEPGGRPARIQVEFNQLRTKPLDRDAFSNFLSALLEIVPAAKIDHAEFTAIEEIGGRQTDAIRRALPASDIENDQTFYARTLANGTYEHVTIQPSDTSFGRYDVIASCSAVSDNNTLTQSLAGEMLSSLQAMVDNHLKIKRGGTERKR